MKRDIIEKPYWESKRLEEMTPKEWDSICDGCGKCCLCKLQDDETGEIFYTNVACKLLDIATCRCTSYKKRKELIPGCAILSPKNIKVFRWLPQTCAYRLLSQGKELFRWHHLISGSSGMVHKLGVSIKNKVVSETHIHPDQIPEHIVDWK